MSLLLSGCTSNKNSTLKDNVQLVPKETPSQTTRLFRQQLVYCTTQYLAISEVPAANVEWVLKAHNLIINSPDEKLKHYLNICAADAVTLMANVDDSGSMEISGIHSSENGIDDAKNRH